MDKWSRHIGGCKTEETVRKGCGTNTNELQPIPGKDCLPCCLLYNGKCRRLSLEDDMINQPLPLGNNMLLVKWKWKNGYGSEIPLVH